MHSGIDSERSFKDSTDPESHRSIQEIQELHRSSSVSCLLRIDSKTLHVTKPFVSHSQVPRDYKTGCHLCFSIIPVVTLLETLTGKGVTPGKFSKDCPAHAWQVNSETHGIFIFLINFFEKLKLEVGVGGPVLLSGNVLWCFERISMSRSGLKKIRVKNIYFSESYIDLKKIFETCQGSLWKKIRDFRAKIVESRDGVHRLVGSLSNFYPT